MHLVRRQYHVDPASVDEITQRIRGGFVSLVSGGTGFVSYTIVDFGGGDLSTFSVFEDRTAADESTSKAAGWVRENLASLVPNPPQVTTAEVVIRDSRAGAQATYGRLQTFRADPANYDELGKRVRSGWLPILHAISGYVSYLALDWGGGTIGSASTYTDEAAAVEAATRAADWSRENVIPLVEGPPQIESGRILLRQVRE